MGKNVLNKRITYLLSTGTLGLAISMSVLSITYLAYHQQWLSAAIIAAASALWCFCTYYNNAPKDIRKITADLTRCFKHVENKIQVESDNLDELIKEALLNLNLCFMTINGIVEEINNVLDNSTMDDSKKYAAIKAKMVEFNEILPKTVQYLQFENTIRKKIKHLSKEINELNNVIVLFTITLESAFATDSRHRKKIIADIQKHIERVEGNNDEPDTADSSIALSQSNTSET